MANDNSLAGEVTISPQYGEDFVHWKRKTALFITGQTISLFGSSLVQFAIIWYITLRTQSGMMMTISTICGFLPQLIISLFSGVWADRYNRRVLIMLADGLISSATLVLAILFLLGHDAIWLLFLVSGIRSIGAGIQSPAVQALLPQIVPVDKLMRVNGINGSIGSFIMLLSPIASGAILTIMTVETAFFIDVVTAAMAITIMFFLKIPPHKKAAEKQSGGYFDDLKEGFKYVKQNDFI
ncbi:MAG: MFS transporter, partial [Vallitaleaceae bacterium]|nr:MFS transporter [Vallitaleaceae bacterium]